MDPSHYFLEKKSVAICNTADISAIYVVCYQKLVESIHSPAGKHYIFRQPGHWVSMGFFRFSEIHVGDLKTTT